MNSPIETPPQKKGLLNPVVRDIVLISTLAATLLVILLIYVNNAIQVPAHFCQLIIEEIEQPDESLKDSTPQKAYNSLTDEQKQSLLSGCGYTGPVEQPTTIN